MTARARIVMAAMGEALQEEIERMRCKNLTLFLALLGLAVAGCGKPAEENGATSAASPAGTQAASTDDPAAAVQVFLEAVRTGNDQKAAEMFTSLARERVSKLGIQVAPQGSDTASFKIGKIERLAPDGARVAATWTDLGDDGKPRTDDMMWMVRQEKEGWRVAGMAATVFPGEPPLLLDFENPEETLKQLDMLRAEISQRSGGPSATAQAQADGAAAQVQTVQPQAQGDSTRVPGVQSAPESAQAQNPENSLDRVRR